MYDKPLTICLYLIFVHNVYENALINMETYPSSRVYALK